MKYNNFSISSGKGKLYLKEKQPTEGYEEVLYGTDGKSKTYHKYFQSIKGIPTYLESKEVQFDGRTLKFLELTLVDGEESNKVSVPLKNKGGYTDEVKLLLSSLNGLDMGQEVTLSTAKSQYKTKAGVDKEQLNIYINYTGRLNDAGKGLSTGFIPFTEIPKPVSELVAGDTVWDWKKQTEFYWGVLTEVLARFQNFKPTAQTPTPTVSTTATATPAPTPKVEKTESFTPPSTEYDSLPF